MKKDVNISEYKAMYFLYKLSFRHIELSDMRESIKYIIKKMKEDPTSVESSMIACSDLPDRWVFTKKFCYMYNIIRLYGIDALLNMYHYADRTQHIIEVFEKDILEWIGFRCKKLPLNYFVNKK